MTVEKHGFGCPCTSCVEQKRQIKSQGSPFTEPERRTMIAAVSPTVRLFRSFLCFDAPLVHAGTSVPIVGQPDLPFKPVRLAVAPSIARLFRIQDLRVGPMSQRVNGGGGASAEFFPPLPFDARSEEKEHDERRRVFFRKNAGVSAELFPALPMSPEERKICEAFVAIDFPTCDICQLITILVENVSTIQSSRFEAILWGTYAEP